MRIMVGGASQGAAMWFHALSVLVFLCNLLVCHTSRNKIYHFQDNNCIEFLLNCNDARIVTYQYGTYYDHASFKSNLV